MRKLYMVAIAALGMGLLAASEAQARITIAPYYSIRSTKAIKPGAKNKATEDETIQQREEKGLKAGIGFFKLLKFELGVGQSVLTTTTKTSLAKDEYDQIDYEKDLNMDTSNQDAEFTTTETQNRAKASLIIDPSFSIFILRAKAGVTATQRIIEAKQGDGPTTKFTGDPVYTPHLGAGAGVKLGRMAYFIAEYNFDLYKFPKTEPFEREVSVSFGVNL
jgi:hypothetical protein